MNRRLFLTAGLALAGGLGLLGAAVLLDVGARVDTGTWLETTGIVREGKGLVWIEGQQIALTKPTLETRNAEVPPIPQMGPPPEVIFTDPAEGEIDVPLKALFEHTGQRPPDPRPLTPTKGTVCFLAASASAFARSSATRCRTRPGRSPTASRFMSWRSTACWLDSGFVTVTARPPAALTYPE